MSEELVKYATQKKRETECGSLFYVGISCKRLKISDLCEERQRIADTGVNLGQQFIKVLF